MPLPSQTHKQRLEERLAIGKELRKQTPHQAPLCWKRSNPAASKPKWSNKGSSFQGDN